MYVRTKCGISQYKKYETTIGDILCIPIRYGLEGHFANIDDIKKTSFKLVNLIEPGDYVNGRLVEDVLYPAYKKNKKRSKGFGNKLVVFGRKDYITEESIKSIITKEQISQIEYKIN